MSQLTDEGRRRIEEIATRHDVSADAALTLLAALLAGHSNQAQFNHPELGGMGQWSRGGMTMVGDMFNNALKARVDALCTELSSLLGRSELIAAPAPSQSQSQGQSQGQSHGAASVSLFVPGGSSSWWPAELGVPASVGAQNDLRYAYFPATRRLAIDQGGRVSVHDTGEHRISGVSQQQGGGQSITFTSQLGLVRVADLPMVDAPRPHSQASPGGSGRTEPPEAAAPVERRPDQPETDRIAPRELARSPAGEDDVFAKIERLAELHRKGILTDAEYEAKKAELLGRL